jgi:hypothetical protein
MPHTVQPVFYDFAKSKALTDRLRNLIGDSGRLYGPKRNLKAPVRLPLPTAKNGGSIYENQTAGKRFFGFK